MNKLPISVAIITLNEAEKLSQCLASVQELASEIVVVDSGSKDQTVEIARDAGCRVEHHAWTGYVDQKNAAMDFCTQPWVLSLDADEVVSPELALAIREMMAAPKDGIDGYAVNRRTWYLGRWILYAWQPEWRLRLVRREKARCGGVEPHDVFIVDGRVRKLKGDLLHYSFRDLHDHLQRTIKYSRIMAGSYDQNGVRLHWHHVVVSPFLAFFKRLVIKQAWRDGWRGWMIAYIGLFGTFAKYAFMLERKLTGNQSPMR